MKTIELKKRFPQSRPEDITKAYTLGFEQGLKSDARAKMYRRQLGGAEAALRRERQRVADLESRLRELGVEP